MKIKVNRVWIDDVSIYIELFDRGAFSEKFEDYPCLKHATQSQRMNFKHNDLWICWDELDEDLSINGFYAEKLQSINTCLKISN